MSNLYTIDGCYDNGDTFEGYLVYEFDNEHPDSGIDEDVFFYGLDRESAIASIGEKGVDFTITAVHDYVDDTDPDSISFEASAKACAESIGAMLENRYGLSNNLPMEADIALCIQEHFTADEI